MKGLGLATGIMNYTHVREGEGVSGWRGLAPASSLPSGYVRPIMLLLIGFKALLVGTDEVEEDRWRGELRVKGVVVRGRNDGGQQDSGSVVAE